MTFPKKLIKPLNFGQVLGSAEVEEIQLLGSAEGVVLVVVHKANVSQLGRPVVERPDQIF